MFVTEDDFDGLHYIDAIEIASDMDPDQRQLFKRANLRRIHTR